MQFIGLTISIAFVLLSIYQLSELIIEGDSNFVLKRRILIGSGIIFGFGAFISIFNIRSFSKR